jgi:catechol 2,3-dioxygenase-like lactoylglutathione lyase family enzyme/predicted enzyme related to lactoylglutathione lyase
MLGMKKLSLALLGVLALAQTPAPAPTGAVVGVGNFSHIVRDLDVALEYYRDVLGLETGTGQPWSGNPAIMKMGNSPGAQSRMVQLKAPNSEIGVELIEYKDIERKPQTPRFQDPGAANYIVRVRDIKPVFARIQAFHAKHKLGRIATLSGRPTDEGVSSHLFVYDPDGFVVEVAQIAPAADAPAGNLLGGGYEFTVVDSDKTAAFYRLLGMELKNMRPGDGWLENKDMADTAGVAGAKFRQMRAPIPGTRTTLTSIEFAGIGKALDRKQLVGRIQDPGTAILQLRVADVEGLTKKLKDAGASVVSAGGVPTEIVPGVKIAIVRDPNNVYLELIQAGR